MAICVGCGLEVNAGLLEVNVCGDPVIPNTTTGGLQCDPNTEGGCLKVVLNDSHAGCGLNAANGALEVDPCLNGGILCGATDDDPEDNCVYVNVQGQGGGPCVALATAQACTLPRTQTSPNCNGLVRTCDGLWAPPKTIGTYSFSLDQDGLGPAPLTSYLVKPATIPDMPGNLGDGFPGPAGDFAVTNNPNYELLFHSFDSTMADNCGLNVYGNTFLTFSISYFVNAGELWRWLLWERVAIIPPTAAAMAAPATIAGSSLNGTGWVLQASFYIDRRNDAGGPFLETIQMNDVSSTGGGQAVRWEYMITAQRLVPGGATNANINNQTTAVGTRQYRLTLNSAHCRPPEASSNAVQPGPIVTFGL